jgi:hypothetical protein
LLYGVVICRSMVFLVPVIVLFFAERIGMSFQEYLASESVFAATVVIMEVPSGWLADIWRRKWAIALGGAIAAIGAGLFIPAREFADTALAQALMGIGISLFSGADSALLYDALRQHDQEGRYRVIEGRRHGFGLYAVAASSLMGGWLFTIDPVLPVWGMVAAYLATATFALFLDEPARPRLAARGRRPGIRSVLSANRVVVLAILLGAALFASTSVAMWSQQPYYMALGIGAEWFGLLMASGFLIGGLAGHFGHHLDRWFGAAAALGLVWLVLVSVFALAGAWLGYGGVVLLLCGPLAWGAGWPLLQTIINRHVGPARRATILSIAGAAIRLCFIPLSAAIGWLAMGGGIGIALIGLSGILFIFGGSALLLLWRLIGGHAPPRISITAREG